MPANRFIAATSFLQGASMLFRISFVIGCLSFRNRDLILAHRPEVLWVLAHRFQKLLQLPVNRLQPYLVAPLAPVWTPGGASAVLAGPLVGAVAEAEWVFAFHWTTCVFSASSTFSKHSWQSHQIESSMKANNSVFARLSHSSHFMFALFSSRTSQHSPFNQTYPCVINCPLYHSPPAHHPGRRCSGLRVRSGARAARSRVAPPAAGAPRQPA